ncbi:MAG: lipoate--protein ligase family protein [Lentisphaeria bacterium]
MRIYESPYQDAVSNAALEEFLFRRRPLQSALLFYRNEDSVLWGRNQNPLYECALDHCLAEKVTLIRRISGGGTVYHDLGNLNYCFVLPREAYDPARYVGLIAGALQDLGLSVVSVCPRHSIWVDNRKVSGTAFALSGPAVLLHGCLLLQTDLQRLQKLLTPQMLFAKEGAVRRIASIRSTVANLQEYVPGLDMPALMDAICKRLRKNNVVSPEVFCPERLQIDEMELAPFRKKFSEASWTLELAKS